MRNSPLRKTTDEFKYEMYCLVGDEYSLLEDYKGCKTDILFQHNSDFCNNNQFLTTPAEFKAGHRCKICGIEQRGKLYRKTHEQFCKEVYDLVQDEYTVLGQYKNSNIKLILQHNSEECNFYKWDVRPSVFFIWS